MEFRRELAAWPAEDVTRLRDIVLGARAGRRSEERARAVERISTVRAGRMLGALAAFVLLPALQLGASVPDNVPATIVRLDAVRLATVFVAVVAGVLVAGPGMAVVAARPRLMAELRALG